VRPETIAIYSLPLLGWIVGGVISLSQGRRASGIIFLAVGLSLMVLIALAVRWIVNPFWGVPLSLLGGSSGWIGSGIISCSEGKRILGVIFWIVGIVLIGILGWLLYDMYAIPWNWKVGEG